ncbi:MAG: negative regulator of beta-lactamase expression [Phycisphaerales bacterium]|nr:negative regulator of beta-lactamase expression [Phycisphaerales bacterium]
MNRLTPLLIASLLLASCKTAHNPPAQASTAAQFGAPGTAEPHAGDEIMVCGQLFHTGAPVVLWTDPGGYDAYRTDRRFAPYEKASFEATTQEVADAKKSGKPSALTITSPNRYSMRYVSPSSKPTTQPTTRELLNGLQFELNDAQLANARAGWKLSDLQQRVDQFVYHYDVAGTSQTCFKVLHDMRGLSVHFMLDIDGTIYQTLDLKERAWHATTSNTRSIGIEIANMGAYPTRANNAFSEWYAKDNLGHTVIHIPARYQGGGVRDQSTVLRPARDGVITGMVQGKTYHQYDLTPQQYASLIKLTATLCTVFPKMKCDYPRDKEGNLIPQKLPDEELEKYQGLMGHFHVQKDKQDPGPAFQWDTIINGARALMNPPAVAQQR